MWLVARRVANIYTQLCTGRAIHDGAFGSLTVLLEGDRAYRASEQFAQDRQFWLDYLADRPDPVGIGNNSPVPSELCRRSTAYLPRSHVNCLHSIAQRTGTSLPHVVSAATAIFLHRFAGTRDLICGLPVAARDGAARHIPGMASNVLPLRMAVQPSMTVSEVVRQAAWQMRRCLNHQRYQIADLRRDLGGNFGDRLFGLSVNIMRFNYDLTFAGHHAVAHNLSLGPAENLSIAVYDRSDGGPLRIDFDANPGLHDAADLADLQQRYLRLLTAIADVDLPIGSLDMLAPEERARIVRSWNDTAHAIAPASLPALFAAQAARTPDATAVVFADERAELCGARPARQPAGASSARRSEWVRKSWSVCASSARPTWWWGCSASSRRAAPTCRSIPTTPAERLALHAGGCRRERAGDASGAARPAAAARRPHRLPRCRRAPRSRRSLRSPLLSRSIRTTRPTSSTPRARPGSQKGSWSRMRGFPILRRPRSSASASPRRRGPSVRIAELRRLNLGNCDGAGLGRCPHLAAARSAAVGPWPD